MKSLFIFIMSTLTIASTAQTISDEFPFESKFLTIKDHQLHYIEEGTGDPILFLHGVPMSAYSWRNIIPHLSDTARCIAIDFMGFGQSDKPNIDYSFDEQYLYLKAFIDQLQLNRITLVMTDIGGILGQRYASEHPDKVKGLVLMETPLGDARTFHKNGGGMQHMLFWMGSKKKLGYNMFVKRNMFLKMMPMLIKRKLSKTEKATYNAPFTTRKSRRALHALASTFPRKGKNATPGDMGDYLNRNSKWLMQATQPKLLLTAKPGMLINKRVIRWAQNNLSNLKVVPVGKAKHLMEEDVPHAIGLATRKWYAEL